MSLSGKVGEARVWWHGWLLRGGCVGVQVVLTRESELLVADLAELKGITTHPEEVVDYVDHLVLCSRRSTWIILELPGDFVSEPFRY